MRKARGERERRFRCLVKEIFESFVIVQSFRTSFDFEFILLRHRDIFKSLGTPLAQKPLVKVFRATRDTTECSPRVPRPIIVSPDLLVDTFEAGANRQCDPANSSTLEKNDLGVRDPLTPRGNNSRGSRHIDLDKMQIESKDWPTSAKQETRLVGEPLFVHLFPSKPESEYNKITQWSRSILANPLVLSTFALESREATQVLAIK
ncbi:hypothetical protein V1477_007479 [Vespula maculifrons]|uniref:Uncharacterized protein n=1 Tax=Vespula maculifrons TaxID=7453 RepID=A0ABD2CIM2_VESMC